MNSFRLEGLSLDPSKQADPGRAKAEKVAGQFEEVFVQTFISSLRQTSNIGEQSMFGSGPGADTYAGWFDKNVANEIGRTGGIGIASALLEDMERHGDINNVDKTKKNVEAAARATDTSAKGSLSAINAMKTGGFDVVL